VKIDRPRTRERKAILARNADKVEQRENLRRDQGQIRKLAREVAEFDLL
jgi:hypothetical protein